MTIQFRFIIEISSLLQLKCLMEWRKLPSRVKPGSSVLILLDPSSAFDLPDPYLQSCWLWHLELSSNPAFIISTGSIFGCVPEKFSVITLRLHCGSATELSSWSTLVHLLHLITGLRNQITWILLPLLLRCHMASFLFSNAILLSKKIADWFLFFSNKTDAISSMIRTSLYWIT